MITIWWSESDTRALPEGGDATSMTVSRLDLDIVESDSYTVESIVTAHAVESGVQITDHVMSQQDRAVFTVVVSSRQSSTSFVENTRFGTVDIGGGNEALGLIVPEGTNRVGDVHDILRRLCRDGIEIDVDGLRRPIEGWLIESCSSPRSVDTAGTLVCEMAIVEVRYAETEEVDAPSPRVERGRRRRDQGRQPTEETSNETMSNEPAQRQESVVHALVNQ